MYLKAWDEHDHHSVVLRQAETPGMDYYGFKVDSKATLDELANLMHVSDFRGTVYLRECPFQSMLTNIPAARRTSARAASAWTSGCMR